MSRLIMVGVLALVVSVLGVDAGGTKKSTKKEPEVGSIEVYKKESGEYRFRIKNAEGKTVVMPLPNLSWEKKTECLKFIEELKETLAKAKPVEVKE